MAHYSELFVVIIEKGPIEGAQMGKGNEEREKRGRNELSTSSVHIFISGFY